VAGKLAYERYHWFHGQVRAGAHPNARTLAERFEFSPKQAQRDIEFMRDRLGAPLTHNHDHRGYGYENAGYELPPLWLKEDELVALSLALRLAAAIPDREFKRSLHHLLEAVMALRSAAPPGFKEVEEKVSVKNIEYYRVREPIFHAIVGALFQNRSLRITYRTPHTGETTDRLIQPFHLLCYMGSRHLIAFCTLRGELRDFTLSRVGSVERADQEVNLPASLPSIKEYIRQNFGVIAGNKSTNVVLKFTPDVAPWVSEQVWHDAQEVSRDSDGSLHLTFPVAGFEEVAREILKYGAGVEVLAPEALRTIVRDEIKKMHTIYR
jgi:predicted DNA-binding transcriptional regulator YafY